MYKQPILIDTDPGVDDFFCLAIGCGLQDHFDLKAVTTMGGNNTTDVTTRNALDILKLFGRDDVPVAKGSDSFLTRPFGKPAEAFHGKNGLGNVEIPHSDRKPDPLPAWDKIYETAVACGGDLILVPVAPYTNIARALQAHPDLPKYVKKIVLMGGSIKEGNITPYAEANAFNDAPATDIVFRSGIPIDMVGLNVTNHTPLTRAEFDAMSEDMEPAVREVMQKLIDFRKKDCLHDAIAISSLVDERFITWKEAALSMELHNPITYGRTVADFDADRKNARVAVASDVSVYREIFGKMAASFSKR